jgi:cytochrome c5
MQEPDQHASPIKNPKQLITVVVLAFAIPIALIVLLSQLVTSGKKGGGDDEASVLARIRPVGEVTLAGGAAPAAAPAAPGAAAAPVAVAAAGKPDGKKVYDTVCMACHMTGAANAPKFGDKAAWAPRLATGIDALYASALHGKNAMPAKGGNAALSDAEVKAGVDYMTAAAK